MEFVVDGKKRYSFEWLVTLAMLVWIAFHYYAKGESTWIELLVIAIVHVFSIRKMTSRITLNDCGVSYKSLFDRKRYSWDEIADYGIVHKKRLSRHRLYIEYTVYFSDSEDTSQKAARHLPYRGIRMRIRRQDVESVACELRNFGREYAKNAPYISEYWE